MLSLSRLKETIGGVFPEGLRGKTLLVGLSGGADSVVLLHLLAQLSESMGFALKALHIHHGLSPNADEWAAFCGRYCAGLNVAFEAVRVKVDKNGMGIEAAARQQRYAVFEVSGADVLALAHHRNDQIETFMLAAVRGGGLRALAAMPALRCLGKTAVWRPLLPFARGDILNYAHEHGLPFVEDESNADESFLRNWMRRRALPEWSERIDGFERHILNNIRNLQEDLALLDEIVEADFRSVFEAGFFDVRRWRCLSERRKTHVLRRFLRQYGVPLPSQDMLTEMARTLSAAATGNWCLGGCGVYYYADRLFVLVLDKIDSLDFGADRAVRGRLKDILTENGFILLPHPAGLPREYLEREGVLRAVDAGDVFRVGGMGKSGKKLLQDKKALPVLRRIWPVLADADNRALALANVCVDGNVSVSDGILPVHPDLVLCRGQTDMSV